MSETSDGVPENMVWPEKSWERMIFDLGDKKIEITIHLVNRSMIGTVMKVASGVVVFREQTDRFRSNITYVPLGNIVSISSYFV